MTKMCGGFLCINKPPGMSSHDVVAWARRVLQVKKVGHTGTLDPAASGVLVLAVGEATKILEFMESESKEYRAECVLGVRTDSQDGMGKILGVKSCDATEEEIRGALAGFVGEIWQVPPMVSAVKHGGRRLYELAKKGIVVERTPRKVRIDRLRLVPVCTNGQWVSVERVGLAEMVSRFAPEARMAVGSVSGVAVRLMLDIECSRGTYVRALCDDLGNRLGCGGYMSFLLRTRSGPFLLSQAKTLEAVEAELADGKRLSDVLLPISYGVPHLPQIHVSGEQRERLENGNRIELAGVPQVPGPLALVVDSHGVEVCVARIESKGAMVEVQPVKVFLRN